MNQILLGDCLQTLKTLPDQSVHCCVTSPPYWGLRDYGHDGQIGQEQTPEAFVSALVAVFREVRRVLRDDGTCWVNLGDSYANDGKWGGSSGGKHAKALHGSSGVGRLKNTTGLPPKSLIGIPWRVAFALQADGWYLRQDIIWHKPNPMPESVRDRFTKAHEYMFLLSKSDRYYFAQDAVKEPVSEDMARRAAAGHTRGQGKIDASRNDAETVRPKKIIGATRNRRSVWTIPTQPFAGAHFATYPVALITPCILAGCPKGGVVLDPFMGAGTTAIAAVMNQRQYLGCELNPKYKDIAEKRIQDECGLMMMFGKVEQ